MKKILLALVLLVSGLFLTAQTLDKEINTLMSKYALFEITNSYFTMIESLYPERATRAGLETASEMLDTRTADAQEKRRDAAAKVKIKLDKIKYKKLTQSERTDYEILKRTLIFDNYLLSKNLYATSPMYYMEAQDAVYDTMLKKINGLRQFKDIEPRLVYLPQNFKDGVKNIKAVSKKDAALAINKMYAAYVSTPKDYTDFLKKNATDSVDASRLNEYLKIDRSALREFFNYTKSLEAAAKPEAKNDYAYRMLLKNKMHLNKPMSELTRLTETSLTRNRTNLLAMVKTLKKTKKQAYVKDFYSIEAADKTAPKYERLLTTIATEIETANKAMKGSLPGADMKVFVSHMPEYTAFINPVAYFLPPYGVEHNLIGTLFINTPADKVERDAHIRKYFNSSRIKLLVTENVVPGRQMFYSYSYETKPIRRVLSSNAIVDGWSAYAKHLAFEQGYLSTKEDALYLVFEDFSRSVGALADIKYNSGELDYDETVLFIMAQGIDKKDAEVLTRRVAFRPGETLSELVGYEEIKSVRKTFEDKLGKDFILASFHNFIFAAGKVPPAMLEAEIDNLYKTGKKIVGVNYRGTRVAR